ncbi:RAMP superfamily CRISPR-associated protein [Nostoc sp.]|uniref:RAMP superfamily CRISPR-associated protein n=1 Tax=Nostoc sp. TaxID=1180 RepID=UPI002FFBF042
MDIYTLKIKLLSDATFGRGDGVAGSVDQEVEHDTYGFPYLRGRTLKGLLSEECDNFIAILSDNIRQHWEDVACQLFGKPGSSLDTIAQIQIGDACLPEDLRQVVGYDLKQKNSKLNKTDILESLTTIRRQTSINPKTGTPDNKSLRSSRVILRELEFIAPLSFESTPNDNVLALLSVTAFALRRIGSGRNRGRGYVKCSLFYPEANEIKDNYLNHFL